MNFLSQKISEIRGIPTPLTEALHNKSIYNLFDLLHYFPKKYEDRSSLLKLSKAIEKTQKDKDFLTTIICRCEKQSHFVFHNRRIKKYHFTDGEAEFIVNAYNPYQKFQLQEHYILSGKLKIKYASITLNVTAYESFDQEAIKSIHLGRIVPIYYGGQNLNQKRIRTLIEKNLKQLQEDDLDYLFPSTNKNKYNFMSKVNALKQIHFPENFSSLKKARAALVYEEFFIVFNQIQKNKLLKTRENHYSPSEVVYKLLKKLPYTLTLDQEKTLQEIIKDLESPTIMNRLLQGDVGTGKTLIAFLIMYWVFVSGGQALLMVPTEVLAKQHFDNLKKLLAQEEVEIVLLTGSHNKKYKDAALMDFAYKEKLIIIGTHALIQEKIKYRNLRLAIVDEQHRFGVEQRKMLLAKGKQVDFLSMTATPIPRSLSMILFADTNTSFLKVKPQSAKKINCKLLLSDDKLHAYRFLFSRILKGEQAYVVFPVIEESTNQKLTSLLKEYQRLRKNFFKSIPIDFIHGKKSAEEKEFIMHKFYNNEIKVLFSTTVLEVGIDHANATVMIIESAHQFGLSQLHQLRGRVGRGEKESYCYLLTSADNPVETTTRLEKFTTLDDGFAIAELDLKIRGPGELLGLKQSGLPEFRLAHLVNDYPILQRVKEDFSGA